MHVFFIRNKNQNISKHDPYVVYASKQLNKFKKVKFMKTHNLLTGETSATPEQIKVKRNVINIFLHKQMLSEVISVIIIYFILYIFT